MIEILFGVTGIILLCMLFIVVRSEGFELKAIVLFVYIWYYCVTPFLIAITQSGEIIYYDTLFGAKTSDLFFCVFRIVVAFSVLMLILSFKNISVTETSTYDHTLSNQNEKIIMMVGILLLILGGGSLVYLFIELGGPKAAIQTGVHIRTYLDKKQYLSPMGSMCKTMAAMIKGALYCFLTLCVIRRSLMRCVLVGITVVLTVLYLFFDAGRSGIVFTVCVIVFGACRIKNINTIKPACVMAFIVMILSNPLKYLMSYSNRLSLSGFKKYMLAPLTQNYSFLFEFSFPISNLLSADAMNNEYGYRYFIDYISWIPELFPQRLLDTFGITVRGMELITKQVSDYYVNMGHTGGTPVDMLTLGLRQIPFLGMLINVALYALLVRLIIWIAKRLNRNYSILLWFIYIFAFDLLISNDLGAMVKAKLGEIVVLLMLVWIAKGRIDADTVDR